MAEAIWRKMFVEEADPGWDEKGLDEIATFLNGLPCQKYPPDTSTEPLPVIKIKELRTGITDDSDMANSEVPPEYIINDGDILFSWSGSLEIVIWSFGKGVLNQHLFKVTSDDYPKWFFYYWLKHHLAEFRDIAQDKATTMGHIQRHHLSAARVLIPDEKSFELLSADISPIFEKMIHNLKAIRSVTHMRDTLLPKLMSGEVKVKI
jgi:type I restriction enzyme S subunit